MGTTYKLIDSPVGHAYSGPAYGEKLKGDSGLGQVIGVVAAVAAVSTGVGMIGAAGGFGAAMAAGGATAASALAGGAMVAGGVLSGVGTLSGDKKLAGLGQTLSLAGGLGGLAANAYSGATAMNAGEGGLFRGMDAGFSGTSSVEAAKVAGAAPGVTIAQGGVAGNSGVLASDGTRLAGVSANPTASPTLDSLSRTGNLAGTNLVSGAGASTANAANAGGAVNLANSAGASAGGTGMNLAAAADKGILGNAMEGFNKMDTMSKFMLGNTAKGIADAAFAPDQQSLIDAQTALANQRVSTEQFALQLQQNQSKVPTMLLENDPEYAAKLAAANAAGIKVNTMPSFAASWTKARTPAPTTTQTTVA